MTASTESARRTPLWDRHLALDATMADFGGWSMPMEYTGTVAEHRAVRESVGMFDVSHMGTVLIFGSGALEAVNTVLTNDLERISDGQAQYTMLCADSGGVIDDLIAYRFDENNLMLIPNATNSDAVVAELKRAVADTEVNVLDARDDHAIIAVQGPHSASTLRAIGIDLPEEYMAFARSTWNAAPVMVCRTGYTGEHGYEIVLPASGAPQLWDALSSAGVIPAGLGARDTLRTEMGYPLHGQELNAQITPVQAGLGFAVGWAKDTFHGRDALTSERESGPARKLRGLIATGRGIPRAQMSVVGGSGGIIGHVTSGTFSPTLSTGIALALIDADIADGAQVAVDVRGRHVDFTVTKPPFVESHVRD